VIAELANELALYKLSDFPKEGQKLEKSLHKETKLSYNKSKPLFVLVNDILVIRHPNVDKNNQGIIDNLAKILKFICEILRISPSKLRLYADDELGKSVNLLSKIERTLDILSASLRLPASQAGEAVQFDSGLKANLPEILAALRVVRRNGSLIRRLTSGKNQKTPQTTADLLRKSFNIRAGFEENGADPWVCNILRTAFSEVTKPTCETFPGEWMHSLRVRNGTKTDLGIVAKMGYTAIQPAPFKAKRVIFTRKAQETIHLTPQNKMGFVVIGTGSDIVRETTKLLTFENFPEGMNYREYRAAVVTFLPFINPKSDKQKADQVAVGPLDPVSEPTLRFFKENPELVDAINLAFAILVDIDNKKSKSTPGHFDEARNHYIRASANIEFQDASGRKYQKYMEIPEDIRRFLEKSLNRKVVLTQRDDATQRRDDEKDIPKDGDVQT